ncbi:hypothetical protein VHEMI08487 [[Torrubiella] hemipterigena]|uniref:Uncharacterized protein n=1 Tax=[Torrubiella] hemipterigena TaxID=1531966 RepID=A0A0A1TDN9_9HYPO|nr:hypothetical protein VHEMI08487 [[Torrubiella] hemipterigena]
MAVFSPSGYKVDTAFTDNILVSTGAGRLAWNVTAADFTVDNNVLYGNIDTNPNATNTITTEPMLAAPGWRDPRRDASADFFSQPTQLHRSIGFYSGEVINQPQWTADFDNGTLQGFVKAGLVDIVPDPAGDLGKSASLAAGSSISRDFEDAGNFRLNVRVLITSDRVEKPAVISIGTAQVVLGGFQSNDVGFWQIVMVTRRDGKVTAEVNGKRLCIRQKGKEGVVKIEAGDAHLFVDEAFIVAL